MTLRYLSLFSGVGGFDLGFDRAGMVCAGQVEYDEKARAVLARHWPDVKRVNDVREVQGDEFGTVDVICGGFPCQDVSVAGRRAGLAGERSGLWFEFHRIIDRVKPRWVVVENVPGLLSSHRGRDFAVILRGLVECGYGVAWRVLDAQYFGVPQRRRRVFIVGYLGDGRAAQVLFEREGGGGDIAAGRSSRPGAAPYAIRRAQTSSNGWGIQRDVTHTLDGTGGDVVSYPLAFGGNNTRGPIDVATAQNAHGGTGRHDFESETFIIAATLNSGGNDGGFRTEPGEHLVMAFQPGNLQRYAGAPPSMSAWPTLGAESHGDMAPHVSIGHGIRRLTPVECERLQGFPDGWTESSWEHPSPDYIAECARKGIVPESYVIKQMSDSARYRQMGNAVAVPVVEWLGRRIVEVSQ